MVVGIIPLIHELNFFQRLHVVFPVDEPKSDLMTMSGVGIVFRPLGMTTIVCLLSLNCLLTICAIIQLTYASSFALTHFDSDARWRWLMLTSNLNALSMKKHWEQFVVKLFTIFCIYRASTSCPGFGMRSSGDIGSSVMTNNFLALLDGVISWLFGRVGVSLPFGVSI